MMHMHNKDAIKTMIEMSDDWEEADKIIMEFTPFKDTAAKLSFLYGMFDVSIVASCGDADPATRQEDDYRSVLSAILSLRWR